MASTSATLTQFFKGSDTQFGIFYPVDYLVAIFPDMTLGQNAEKALVSGGFPAEDVIAVPGEEVVRFANENLEKSGLWSLLMQRLSRMFATEEIYADRDLKLAKGGAAFLAVYCPTEQRKKKAWDVLNPLGPIVARHYALDGIEHFKGEL